MDFIVTVVPFTYLTNNPLDTSICNGQSTGLTLLSNVSGTQFTWTADASSGSVSGYSNTIVPGNTIDQVLFNSGFTAETVTYHITPENASCPVATADYTVTVFPSPDLFFLPDGETLCEGQSSNISIQSHVAGTSFSWTAIPSSDSLSGYSDGSGNVIAQTIFNSDTITHWVTYQVTPVANGCPAGPVLPVVLSVNHRPLIISNTTQYVLCSNTSTNIELQADISSVTFAWRAIGSSLNLGGFTSGTGANIIQSLTNSGYTIETVTYRAAATSNNCTGDSVDFTVTVNPVPDIAFIPDGQPLCSGQITGLTLQSQVPGTSFTWTAVGSDTLVSGYGPGSGISIQQTLTNSGYLSPWVTYTVFPSINGCPGIQNSAIVTVNPLPVVSMTPCFDTLTSTNGQPIHLKGGIPRGGIYSGPGVVPGSGTFDPTLAGVGTHQVTYSYTNEFNCSGSSSLSMITYQMPNFTCGDSLVDIRDNRKYPTVNINGQCWMAADLNFGTGILSSQAQRDNCLNEKYCFEDVPSNCITYGGLYQWDEVMQYTDVSEIQGMCPPGWHLPSETEWNTLFNFYTTNAYAGDALKAGGSAGFNAVTSGVRFHNSIWKFPANDPILQSKLFWSSSKHGMQRAWAHGINEVVTDIDYTHSVSFYPGLRTNAFAVRCLKD